MMARRRNTHCYEDLSPSKVVPDHFSSNQSSTIVIIYDEPVGIKEDQVNFIFPGEMSGGPLKKVVPERVDSRTFVIETPKYSVVRRGFVCVSPQIKMTSGEVVEMADFKISLKHPVRNVMELCLNLSTQKAVLPVLLTLMMNSNRGNRHFFEDSHFDRIMATLVGSMNPGTRRVKDILLPEKKWKKSKLIDFAREFKMGEMEKQAYLVAKRGKEKKKGDKVYVDYTHNSSELLSDDEAPPPVPLSLTTLSLSTPNINSAHINSSDPFDIFPTRGSSIASTHSSPRRKNKMLPKVPIKRFDPWSESLDSPKIRSFSTMEQRLDPDGANPSNYDPVVFDIEDEPPTTPSKRPTTPSKTKGLKSLKLKSSIKASWKLPMKKEEIEDDRASLGSYEDMNGAQEDGVPVPLRKEEPFGHTPPKREESFNSSPPDPSTRAKMPIPPLPTASTSPSKNPNFSPSHLYSLSTKNKVKDRPLPPEPTCLPPPPSKPPVSDSKPPVAPKISTDPLPRRFTGRSKDVYVQGSDSDSDYENDDDANIAASSKPLPAEPTPSGKKTSSSAAKKKRPYYNMTIPEPLALSSSVVEDDDDEHLYDSAEILKDSKVSTLSSATVSDGVPRDGTGAPLTEYENVSLKEKTLSQEYPEPPYDENPSLPPLRIKPALKPKLSNGPSLQDSNSHAPAPPKKPVKRTTNLAHSQSMKIKIGPIPPPKGGMETSGGGMPPAPPTKPNKKTIKGPIPPQKQLSVQSELNAILQNRNPNRKSTPGATQNSAHSNRNYY